MSTEIKNEYTPEIITFPGVTLAEALEERSMSQAELSERTGRPRKTINEIIKGRTAITPETAIQLERVLGIPASFWNNRQRQFDESMARAQAMKKLRKHVDWLDNFPVAQMVKLGWMEKRESRVGQLERLLSFFSIGSPDEWEKACRAPWIETAFRESSVFETNFFALSAWLRKGEIDASSIDCSPFEKTAFKKTLEDIRIFVRDTPKGIDTIITQKCAESGVAVVFVPLIKGVHAWGATRWISPRKAILILSLRGKLEDIFWFTFYHEAAHLLLHGKRDIFVEGIKAHGDREADADSFAGDFLIPGTSWKLFMNSNQVITSDIVEEFACGIGISPAVVVGRLQHEKRIPNSQLNELRKRIDCFISEEN